MTALLARTLSKASLPGLAEVRPSLAVGGKARAVVGGGVVVRGGFRSGHRSPDRESGRESVRWGAFSRGAGKAKGRRINLIARRAMPSPAQPVPYSLKVAQRIATRIHCRRRLRRSC